MNLSLLRCLIYQFVNKCSSLKIISMESFLSETLTWGIAEAAVRRSSSEKVFLKMSQYSQETLVLESLFDKVQVSRPAALLKRASNSGVFL